MIASVFGKSKPINIIIVAVFLILFLSVLGISQTGFGLAKVGRLLFNVGILIFSLFLLDFINTRNNLTQKNSYTVLFFGLFIASFPQIVLHTDHLLSNLFLLFALRRLISLHSRKSVKKKLFDASFWITLAAVINPWSFVFIIVVLIAVGYFSGNDVKTALIPLIGMACVLVLKICYNILFFYSYLLDTDFVIQRQTGVVVDFSPGEWVVLGLFFLLFLWSAVKLLGSMKDRNAQLKPAYMLWFWAACLTVVISVFSGLKEGGAFVYALAPAALMLALNIETIQRPWLLNTVIALVTLLPLIQLVV
jgi:hypothetical protein